MYKSLQKHLNIESSVYEDFTAIFGNKQNQSVERHRIVFFKDYDDKEVRFCTNLMNISAETIAEIYKARWEVEVFFKWIKQNLNMKKVFGTSKNAVYGQLYSGLIAYLILRIIYNYSSARAKFFNYSFITFFRNILFENLDAEWGVLICTYLDIVRELTLKK